MIYLDGMIPIMKKSILKVKSGNKYLFQKKTDKTIFLVEIVPFIIYVIVNIPNLCMPSPVSKQCKYKYQMPINNVHVLCNS